MADQQAKRITRNRISGRACLVVAWVVLCAACRPADDLPTALAQGELLIQARAWEDALKHFDRLQHRFPSELEPVTKLAFVADRLGRPEAAIPILEERIATGGSDVSSYHRMLGTLLENSVELPLTRNNPRSAERALTAERHYREALRFQPDDGPLYLKLSRLAVRTGRDDEALTVAEEGVRQVPDDPQIHSWYGDLLVKKGRWEEAEDVLLRALELETGVAYAHYVLGLVYLNTGRPAAAKPHLETATRLQPEAHRGWYQLANACERVGDLETRDRALAEFETLYRRSLESEGRR